ncbi:Peptidase-M3 domain-containing protein [Aphelenchoides bicaudatus]|nr:Peptidase-M3 domain-containing protein [Aphelenchoides bicaudatus]
MNIVAQFHCLALCINFSIVQQMRKAHSYGSLSRTVKRLLTTRANTRLLTARNDVEEQKRSIVFKIYGRKPQRLTGYFVTFPAIPDETIENNNLLANMARNEDWPPLASASRTKEFYEGTIRLLMEHGATVLEHAKLLETVTYLIDKELPRTFENVLDPLMTELYDVDYAFFTLLLKMRTDWPECPNVLFDKDMSQVQVTAGREHIEKLSDKNFQEALQSIYDSGSETDPWKARLLVFFLLEIRALGIDKWDKQTRSVIGSWSRFMDEYRQKYLTNIFLTNEDHVFNITNPKALVNAPPHVKRILAEDKSKPMDGPWRAKMEPESIYTLLKYCDERSTRSHAWHSWVSRAGFDHGDRNNSINIEEIRHNSEGLAKTLGYSSVAEHRLANKMVGTPATVRKFLNALTRRMRPVFLDRMTEWQQYASNTEHITGGLEHFDLFYISRREAESHCNVESLELMKYFSFWPTLENIFQIVSHLFNLKFVDVTNSGLERCHPSVRIYSVGDKSTGEHLGRLYIDPFQRDNKRGSWLTLLGRPTNNLRGFDKLVYLIGDANEPTNSGNGQPEVSLLYHTQLRKLLFNVIAVLLLVVRFNCFAHAVLTENLVFPQTPHYAADWDAVDMFPTFLEFFVYKPSLLAAISCPNVETGEILNDESVNLVSLALSRATLWDSYRSLFWSDFDLTIFEMEDRKQSFWLDLYRNMHKEYFPFKLYAKDYYPCSFTPIFAMPATMSMYYRKLWAEMLALDIHETFNREKDPQSTGERLKTAVLNPGAGEMQGELYRRFQGRDPSVAALCDFYDPPMSYLEDGSNPDVKQVQ